MPRLSIVNFVVLTAVLGGCHGGHGGEPACINVDGDGDYSTITDALADATAGQTINICAIQLEETVTVDKDVTLLGAGKTETFWNGPTNEPALAITGGTVNVENIGFTSTRSGIKVDDATLVATDVGFYHVDNYAIDANNSSVTGARLRISDPKWGGVSVKNGDLTLTDADISGPIGFGVKLDTSTGTLSGNKFSNVVYSGDGSNVSDGWGVWLVKSQATLANDTFDTDIIGDVRVEGANATVAMNGDTSTNSYIGLWFESTSGSLTDVTIDGYQQYGIVENGGQTLDMTNVSVSTDPATAAPQTAYNDLSGAYGLIALGPDVTWTGGQVSGGTGGGIYFSSNGAARTLNLDGVTVDGNARNGIYIGSSTGVFNDVTVSNTVNDDTTCYDSYQDGLDCTVDDCGSIVCNMAVGVWSSDVTWTGGSVANNGTFGVTPVIGGAVTLKDVTFDHAADYAVWSFAGAMACDGCVFDGSKQAAVSLNSSSTGVLRNSTVKNGSYTQSYSWDDTNTYVYYYAGMDAQLFSDSTLIVEGSTFQNGENGIEAYGGAVQISDTTFDQYNEQAVYAYQDAAVSLTDTTFTNVGNQPIYCYLSAIQAENVAISGVDEYQYKYEHYIDGVLDESGSSSYGIPGVAIEAGSCTLQFQGVTIDDVAGAGVWAADTSIDWDNVRIRDVSKLDTASNGGVHAEFATSSVDVRMNDVTVTGVGHGPGIQLGRSMPKVGDFCWDTVTQCIDAPDDGEGYIGSCDANYWAYALDSDGLKQVCGDTSQSIDLQGLGIGVASDAFSGVASGDGLYVHDLPDRGGVVSAADFAVADVSGIGMRFEQAPATLSNGTVSGTGGDGVYMAGGTLDASGVTIDAAGGSGIHVAAGTHSIRDNAVSGAASYGLECEQSAEITDCSTNTLAGTLGATLDCSGCP